MERLIHGATRLLLWLSGLSLFGLACITVMEVILRYAGSPTSWANDFVGYGLAFSLFFAFPEVTRVKGHVAITFLMDNLPNRLSLVRVMNLVAFLVVAVTIYVAVQVFFVQLSTGVQTVSATPIPKSWLNAGLIIGLSVAALEFLLQIVHSDSSQHG
ncbi:MAG: TRAP transporter small permease [Litorivicinaceae bacterium]|mgnify:FL=1|tara:strand:- start:340 stop:810 length:471 start_codon:yes stop_codon:yes gene_type:complete